MKNENVRKLREMRLPVFASTYLEQMEHPEKYDHMTFDERMALMVDREFESRNSNRIKRMLRKSNLPLRKASIADIAYLPERHLDRGLIDHLATNEFIVKKRNLIVLGATGAGKTYLSNAIAADACRAGFHVLYVRLPDFFVEYSNAIALHKEFELLKTYQKAELLVIDEFLLLPATEPQQRTLLELLERRYGRSSTIFCSQYNLDGWHEQLGGSAIADSILDRITPNAYKIVIQGDVSMRQRFNADD